MLEDELPGPSVETLDEPDEELVEVLPGPSLDTEELDDELPPGPIVVVVLEGTSVVLPGP